MSHLPPQCYLFGTARTRAFLLGLLFLGLVPRLPAASRNDQLSLVDGFREAEEMGYLSPGFRGRPSGAPLIERVGFRVVELSPVLGLGAPAWLVVWGSHPKLESQFSSLWVQTPSQGFQKLWDTSGSNWFRPRLRILERKGKTFLYLRRLSVRSLKSQSPVWVQEILRLDREGPTLLKRARGKS